jgi:hypothetical protein
MGIKASEDCRDFDLRLRISGIKNVKGLIPEI